jgi:surface antigen
MRNGEQRHRTHAQPLGRVASWPDPEPLNRDDLDSAPRPAAGMLPAQRLPHSLPTATPMRRTAKLPAVTSKHTAAGVPAAPPTRSYRVPARLPSLLDDVAPPQVSAARPARTVDAFLDAQTAKLPTVSRRTTLIPAVPRSPSHQDTRLSVLIASLEVARPWQPSLPSRPLRQVLTTMAAMACAIVAVLGLLFVRAASAGSNPAHLSASAGNQIGLMYAASLQSTPVGSGAWQAYVNSVPVLGGGGASAPASGAPQATATTAPAATAAPAQQHLAPQPAATATPRPQPTATPQPPSSGILPAPENPWPPANEWSPVPGHTSYAKSDYAGDPYAYAFGQCTWWAQYERRDENLRGMGNARYWATGAAGRGLRVGTIPVAGATVVFQPDVQGAGWAGHVAHVIALYPDGWFLISEMNAYGNGGGWGRVSFRYAHTGSGVQFIY